MVVLDNPFQKSQVLLTKIISLSFFFYVFVAFLLARAQILGGLYPFGAALIAAVAIREARYAIYALIGTLLAVSFSMQGKEMIVQAGTYLLITSLVYFYPAVSRRIIIFPFLAAAVDIVVKGVAASFIDGSSYNAMVVLFESILVGGLTPVLYVALRAEPWAKEGVPLTSEEYVCFLLFVMALIMGVGEVSYNFISVKGTVSRYCILLAAWMGGPGAGAAIGALVGIIPSLSNPVAPSVVGNFAFGGLLAGAFKTFNKLGVIIGFMLANLLLALYYLNQPAVLGTIAESLIASFFLLMTPQTVFSRLGIFAGQSSLKGPMPAHGAEDFSLREIVSHRLSESARVFEDLARSFNQVAAEEIKEEEEANRLFTAVNRLVCQDCAIHKICWELDYHKTCRNILEMFNVLDTKGFINLKHLNPDIKKRCSRMRELVVAVSGIYDNYQLNTYWRKKFAEHKKMFASQFRGISSIMQKLSGELDTNLLAKQYLQSNLAAKLEREGLHVDKARVLSYSEKGAEIAFRKESCLGLFDCAKIVSKAVSSALGREYNVYDGTCSLQSGEKECKFRLVPKGNLRITYASRQLVKEGNVISGDTVLSTMLKDGKHLFLLSDGMGSGPAAAQESQSVVMLLEQLLEIGFDKETALQNINALLAGRRGKDNFATIDLVIIDLLTSATDFIKIAASPCFIKRGQNIITIKGENPPIGVTNNFEVETLSKRVAKNDYLIMITDGVLEAIPAYHKEEWFADRLRELPLDAPGEIAEALLNKVILAANGKIKDDMTILVAYVY